MPLAMPPAVDGLAIERGAGSCWMGLWQVGRGELRGRSGGQASWACTGVEVSPIFVWPNSSTGTAGARVRRSDAVPETIDV